MGFQNFVVGNKIHPLKKKKNLTRIQDEADRYLFSCINIP